VNLREAFKDHVSSGAFKTIDGELRILGKWGQISVIGDLFDIWFIQPDMQPLTKRKLTFIKKMLPVELSLTELTGEAHTQTPDISLVLETLPVLGVRKRKQLSSEAIEKIKKQLKGEV